MPFVTFFPAIMLAAIFLGWRFATITAIAAAIIGNRLFRGHPGVLLYGDAADFMMLGLYALSCAIMIVSGETLRRSFRKLELYAQNQETLSGELRHRIRNTLQIVQSFAEITARFSPPGEFLPAFSARISALSIATDRLADGLSQEYNLKDVIEDAIRPFRNDGQFEVHGPECALSRELCVTLMLALHELCTNALKYGALSVPSGRILIGWSRASADPDGTMEFRWKEVGGPPVERPVRRGMGSILLETQSELGLSLMDFCPDGLECKMNLRIAK